MAQGGRAFHLLVHKLASTYFNTNFLIDHAVKIGTPPKPHRFDLVSTDGKIVGECKSYSWTEAGNIPSAKLAHLNEAVLYLYLLPEGVTRFLALRRAHTAKRSETLAEYYVRMNSHLLRNILVLEVDVASATLTQLWPRK